MRVLIIAVIFAALAGGYTNLPAQTVSEKKISDRKHKNDSSQTAAAKSQKKVKKSKKKAHEPSAWDASRTGDTSKKKN